MKVTIELDAESIDWKELTEKVNDAILETATDIHSLEISCSELEEN